MIKHVCKQKEPCSSLRGNDSDRRVKGIEALIGERYNQYAVLDNLVSVAVYADYEKYHTRLEDKNLKKYVPPFDMKAAGAYIFVDLNKGVSVL